MHSCHIIELLVNTWTSINYWDRLAILYLCDVFSAVQWHLLVSAASICSFLMRSSSVPTGVIASCKNTLWYLKRYLSG